MIWVEDSWRSMLQQGATDQNSSLIDIYILNLLKLCFECPETVVILLAACRQNGGCQMNNNLSALGYTADSETAKNRLSLFLPAHRRLGPLGH